MDEFYEGLATWWAAQSANAFYTGIGGRLRNNIALQQDEIKPYCVFTQIDGQPEYFVDADYDELAYMEIQLDIYSETNLEVLALAKKAMTLFDGASFSITGWSLLEFVRTRNLLMPPEFTGELGKTEFDFILYRYLISYNIVMQKSRT